MIGQLHYISQGATQYEHIDNIQQACKAGCKWIQLRLKNVDDDTYLKTAQRVKSICNNSQAFLIINDRPDIAIEVLAKGVHLGKTDMSVKHARDLLGKEIIIGGTANSFEDCLQLINQGVDYIGLGPFQYTSTKKNLSPILGLNEYDTIIHKLRENRKDTPILAIGGITLEDIPSLMKTGVHGIAISGLITRGYDKYALVSKINDLILCH